MIDNVTEILKYWNRTFRSSQDTLNVHPKLTMCTRSIPTLNCSAVNESPQSFSSPTLCWVYVALPRLNVRPCHHCCLVNISTCIFCPRMPVTQFLFQLRHLAYTFLNITISYPVYSFQHSSGNSPFLSSSFPVSLSSNKFKSNTIWDSFCPIC